MIATKLVNTLTPDQETFLPTTLTFTSPLPVSQVTGGLDSGLSLPCWVMGKGGMRALSLSFLRI